MPDLINCVLRFDIIRDSHNLPGVTSWSVYHEGKFIGRIKLRGVMLYPEPSCSENSPLFWRLVKAEPTMNRLNGGTVCIPVQ